MRKITSLTIFISFLVMTYTGIMLFISPHGRIAYWSDWKLWGLSKDQYGEIHTTSMVLFVSFVSLHIYYNWKPILNYIKNSAKKISFTKKEVLIALGINFIFVAGTLSYIPPFNMFLNFEAYIKNNWAKKLGEPLYGHAELSTLKVFCKKADIDLQTAQKKLKERGIKFNTNQNLKTISKNNGLSPEKLYLIIKPTNSTNHKNSTPSMLGRKTLKELSKEGYIDINHALKVLAAKGVKDIDPNRRIKDIADELDIMPINVYDIIKK